MTSEGLLKSLFNLTSWTEYICAFWWFRQKVNLNIAGVNNRFQLLPLHSRSPWATQDTYGLSFTFSAIFLPYLTSDLMKP